MPEVKTADRIDRIDPDFEKAYDEFLRQAPPKDLDYLKKWGCNIRNFYTFRRHVSRGGMVVLIFGPQEISIQEFFSIREAVEYLTVQEVHGS